MPFVAKTLDANTNAITLKKHNHVCNQISYHKTIFFVTQPDTDQSEKKFDLMEKLRFLGLKQKTEPGTVYHILDL